MSSTIVIDEVSSSALPIREQSINDSDSSDDSEYSEKCCDKNTSKPIESKRTKLTISEHNQTDSYAGNKNTAEGLMDIALLSANANQLRFLITYNHDASTYYISITLVALSLIMQVVVGIALIFKRRFRRCRNKRYNELILGSVFIITVVNILLAAFTTTDTR